MPRFELDAAFSPTADQPAAIRSLAEGVEGGERFQTLLGATGTGKTMTMAGVVQEVQKPALVIAHNKTLAAQLCNEFRTYFPRTPSSTSCPTTTTTSPRPTSPAGTCT